MSHDGKTIFRDSLRGGNSDIWYATRPSTSEPFGQAVQLNQVNTGFAETRPFVSWSGDVLIVSSNSDIWFATREKNAGD